MTTVVARVPAGRSIGPDTFADLTDSEVSVDWADEGQIEVTLTPDVDEATVLAVRIRMISEGPDDEQLRGQAAEALAANRTFLALASPTNAQTLAQVKALTRQMNAVIRLAVNDLSGTD